MRKTIKHILAEYGAIALVVTSASSSWYCSRQDVRVRELGGDLYLAQEPLAPYGDRQAGIEDLDGDLAPRVLLLGQKDRGHPATAQLAPDNVSANDGG